MSIIQEAYTVQFRPIISDTDLASFYETPKIRALYTSLATSHHEQLSSSHATSNRLLLSNSSYLFSLFLPTEGGVFFSRLVAILNYWHGSFYPNSKFLCIFNDELFESEQLNIKRKFSLQYSESPVDSKSVCRSPLK